VEVGWVKMATLIGKQEIPCMAEQKIVIMIETLVIERNLTFLWPYLGATKIFRFVLS